MEEFEVLEKEYMNKDRIATDIVFKIIKERVRVATELIDVGKLSDDEICQVSQLSIADINSIRT